MQRYFRAPDGSGLMVLGGGPVAAAPEDWVEITAEEYAELLPESRRIGGLDDD